MVIYLSPSAARARSRTCDGRLMVLSPVARIVLRALTGLVLLFLYVPIFLIAILSFNKAGNLVWPPPATRSIGGTPRCTTRACATRCGPR